MAYIMEMALASRGHVLQIALQCNIPHEEKRFGSVAPRE
jgi:hypothetical protein